MSFSSYFTQKSGGDRIFAVEAPKIKFGRDSLLEIGDDANALGMKRVAVFTDRHGWNCLFAEKFGIGVL